MLSQFARKSSMAVVLSAWLSNMLNGHFLYFPSSLSLQCALRESGCRVSYEPTKMSRDHFWRSTSRDTKVEVSGIMWPYNFHVQIR